MKRDRMRIWLDDIRPMPEGFDMWIKDAYEAIAFLMSHDNIDFISFDHDLGITPKVAIRENNGYTVAGFIEGLAYFCKIKKMGWDIHSANPVGRKNIEMAMNNADKYWRENEHS
jgi:hypothetical protein